ncbi:MAG: AbrB/MazE/SpoVT family DNA-binding domain-containing protein [Thermoleophilaceae bacterium]
MTMRMGPKGQVVVPKRIRERLGLRAGDELVVEEQGGVVRISKPVTADDLLGSLPPSSADPAELLLEERRREREREDRGRSA